MEQIGLEIVLAGADKALKNMESLKNEVSRLQKEFNKADFGTEAYDKLKDKLSAAKVAYSQAKAEQKKFQTEAAIKNLPLGSYDQLQAKLTDLKKSYKLLGDEARNSTEGQEMLKNIAATRNQLVGLDEQLGDHTRKVGDYDTAILKALGKSRLGGKIEAISSQLGSFGAVFSQVAIGFAAFQGVAQAGKFVYDFAKQFEDASKVVQAASGEMGASVQTNTETVVASAQTFGVSVEDISAAAKSLADTGAVDFATALDLVNEGLLAGQADAEGYLKAITDNAEAFDVAGQASSEYRAEQEATLAANKELAKAQGQLSAEFQSIGGAVGKVGIAIKTGLVNALLIVINFFKPLVKSTLDFWGALYKLADRIGAVAVVSKLLYNGIYILSIPFRLAIQGTKLFYDSISSLINGFFDIIDSVPLLKSGFDKMIGFFVGLVDVVVSIPRYFGDMLLGIQNALTGMVSAVGGAVYSIVDTISFGLLDKTVQQYKAFNAEVEAEQERVAANERARAQVEAENIRKRAEDRKKALEGLKKDFEGDFYESLSEQQKKAFEGVFTFTKTVAEIQGKDAGAAYAEAYAAGLQALGKLGVDVTTKEQKKLQEEQAKNAEEAAKKRAEEAKREAERRAEQRKQAQQKEIEDIREHGDILLSLTRELANLNIENLKDEEERKRAQAKQQYKQETEDRKQSLADSIADLEAQAKEVEAAFGKNSEQAKASRARANESKKQETEVTNAILTQLEVKLQNDLLAIDKEGAAKKAEEEKKAFEKRIAAIKSENQDELELARVKGEGLILDLKKLGATETIQRIVSFNQRRKLLNKELEQLNEEQLARTKAGVALTEEEERKLVIARQKLLNDLKKLDLEEAAPKPKEEEPKWKKLFDTIAEYSLKTLQTFNDLATAISAQNLKKVEERITAQNNLIVGLEAQRDAELDGLRKTRLARQVEQEKKNAERLVAEKEKIEKQQRKRAKAVALAEIAINTAVAATKVAPNPFLIGAVLAFGLAQALTVGLTEFASGGAVNRALEKTPASGGKIQAKSNYPATPEGDSVVILANPDEVILNQNHVRALGWNTLQAAGVPMRGIPKFAGGGLVAMPSPNTTAFASAVRVNSGTQSNQAEYLGSIIALSTQRQIEAQLDRVQPVLATSELQELNNQNYKRVKSSSY